MSASLQPATTPDAVCGVCQSPLQLPTAEVRILNDLKVSVAAWSHPEGVECAQCGTYFVPFMAQVQAAIGLQQAEKPSDAPRVIVPKFGPNNH